MCIDINRVALLVLLAALEPQLTLAQSPTVTLHDVRERQIPSFQQFVGSVHPWRRSVVGTALEGRVVDLMIQQGNPVKKGQPIAKLRTLTLELELKAAKAELASKQAELEELRNGARPEEQAKSHANLESAKVSRDLAETRLTRVRSLFEQKTTSADELELAESAFKRAEQLLRVAEADHKLVLAGPRTERIEQARAVVDRHLAIVERLDDQIARHTIVAPFDGHVVAEETEVGEWLKQGDAVAEIVQLDQIEVEVKVPERSIGTLKVGATAPVRVQAYPERQFEGTIFAIVPDADLRSRSFPVKVKVTNPTGPGQPFLRGGMFAQIKLPTGPNHLGILIPKRALVAGSKPRVMRFEPREQNRGVVTPVPVRLGVARGNQIEVTAGLKNGDRIVANNPEGLRQGQQVVVTTARSTP